MSHSDRKPGGTKRFRVSVCGVRRSLRSLCRSTAVLFVFGLVSPSLVMAVGDEYRMRRHDLDVTIDSRWAGAKYGGYYPIRVRVTNAGPPRNLTIRFRPQEKGMPLVEKRVGADQNATVQLSLYVPMVGTGTYGSVQVLADGRPLEGMSRELSLPDLDQAGLPRPALVVISPNAVDLSSFETRMQWAASRNPSVIHHGGYYGAWGYGGGGYYAEEDSQVVSPAMLPDSWIGYSGVDLVAVPMKTLSGLPNEQRQALLQWVQTGGNLLVHSVGAAPSESKELARALGLGGHAYVSDGWVGSDLQERARVPAVQSEDPSAGVSYLPPGAVEAVSEDEAEVVATGQEFTWAASLDTFARRELMLGMVYAFEDDPFPGSTRDWGWFLQSMPKDATTGGQWASRLTWGRAARRLLAAGER